MKKNFDRETEHSFGNLNIGDVNPYQSNASVSNSGTLIFIIVSLIGITVISVLVICLVTKNKNKSFSIHRYPSKNTTNTTGGIEQKESELVTNIEKEENLQINETTQINANIEENSNSIKEIFEENDNEKVIEKEKEMMKDKEKEKEKEEEKRQEREKELKKEKEIELEKKQEQEIFEENVNEKETEKEIKLEKESEKELYIPPLIPDNKESEENEKNNYFIATYKSEKDKNIKAFNPFAVLVQDGEYMITYSNEQSTTNPEDMRNLDEIESEINITNTSRGNFISPEDGFINIKVYFLNELPSLDFLFYECEDLIQVDLSHLNTINISRISYTFYGCTNLEQINFTSLETSNLQNMEFLFAGCENLVEIIGFEDLNTSSIKYTSGMFLDCKNLQIVNLSSFNLDYVEEQHGMFVNTESLQLVNLGNCTDANNLFDKDQVYNLVILSNENINISSLSGTINIYNTSEENNITEILSELSCVEGIDEKCTYCDMFNPSICGGCNYGYYLPMGNKYSKTKCKKCDKGCYDCYAEEDSDISICIDCDFNYSLYQGKCIEYCDIGPNSGCSSCKNESEGKNNECLSCIEGYYLDLNYSKSKCKKIEIENCTKAIVENGTVICLNCSKGNKLYDNKCYEACKTGTREKCKTCNPIVEYRFYCGSCNDNYYLYNGLKSTECKPCSTIDYCIECDYIAGEKACTVCRDGFVLVENKCYPNCTSDCKKCYFDPKKSNEGICVECKEQMYLKNYEEYNNE